MRLRCFECGRPVSTDLPDETVVRATLFCPECLALADPVAFDAMLKSMTTARARRDRDEHPHRG